MRRLQWSIAVPVLTCALIARGDVLRVTVESFGARGDGWSVDSNAIQHAINAAEAQPGSTLVFSHKRYCATGLQITAPLTIEGNGATLICNDFHYPKNTIMCITCKSGAEATWKQKISAGQNVLACGAAAKDIRRGHSVYIALGVDPYDPTQPHYATVCNVLANDQDGNVTIDRVIPYDIEGNGHKITPIIQPNSGTRITDLYFDYSVPIMNVALWVDKCNDVTIDNIGGRCGGVLLNTTYSTNVHVRNVTADLYATSPSGGRVFGGWHCENVTVENVEAALHDDSTAAFLESWMIDCAFRNWTINCLNPKPGKNNVLHVAGGCYDIKFDGITFNNIAPILTLGSGGSRSEVVLGDVDLNGPVEAHPLYLQKGSLRIEGKLRPDPVQITMTIPITGGMFNTFPICKGLIRRLIITASSLAGFNTLCVKDSESSQWQLLARLRAGGAGIPVENCDLFGSIYPGNTVGGNEQKYLVVVTDPAANGSLHVMCEYYPSP